MWTTQNQADNLKKPPSEPEISGSRDDAQATPEHNAVWHSLATRPTSIQPEIARSPADALATAPHAIDGAVTAPGQPLDAAMRDFFEPRLGHDFSEVRLHTDAAAASSAQAIDALAYTLGSQIVIDASRYQPGTIEGDQLIAHELAHVVQQSGGGAGIPGAAAEVEADRAAATAAMGGRLQSPLRAASAGIQRAVTTWTPPVRADELGTTLDARTTEVSITGGAPGFDKFSVFVPSGAPADINNVHVFFAANAVVGANANDVMIHGLRAAAEPNKWILIGVPGFDAPPPPGFQTISTAQIQACLTAAGRKNTDIASLRLTAHSRGHRGLEQTLMKGLIKTSLIDRVTVLDAFYQDTKKAIVGAGIDKSKVTQYDLVDALGTKPGERSRVPDDKRILLSKVLSGTKHPVTDYLAAMGYVRLLQDLGATRPAVATQLAAKPLVAAQVASVKLPPRGSFMTFGTGGLGTDLNTWITKNHAPLDAILAVDNDASKGGLLDFINSSNLLGFGTGVWSRYISAHHFFVAEIAHELFE